MALSLDVMTRGRPRQSVTGTIWEGGKVKSKNDKLTMNRGKRRKCKNAEENGVKERDEVIRKEGRNK